MSEVFRTFHDRKLGSFSPPLGAPLPGEYDSPFGRRCAAALRDCAGTNAGLIWLHCAERRPDRTEFTFGDLVRILGHRNKLCSLVVTRDELERFIAEQQRISHKRKYRRILFASGIDLFRPAGGGPPRVEAPDTLSIVVNDYLVSASGVLRPLVGRPERRFRLLDKTDVDAVADALAAEGKKNASSITNDKDNSK